MAHRGCALFLVFGDTTGEKWYYQNVEGKVKNTRKDAEKKKESAYSALENGLLPCLVCSQPWATAARSGLLKSVAGILSTPLI